MKQTDMERALIRILEVTIKEVLTCDLTTAKAEDIIHNISEKSETVFSPAGEQELIDYLQKLL
jgi:hypothetical protein